MKIVSLRGNYRNRMKQIQLLLLLLYCSYTVYAQQSFKFALFTDLHIQMNNPSPEQDLEQAVIDVNKATDLDFVLINGDITESGDLPSLKKTSEILGRLNIPWFITSGNHETKWTPSGGTSFKNVFGNDKFSFEHKGYRFIGFNTGPIIKMGDGHIYPQDYDWVENELQKTGENTPVFIITHYPLLKGDVDNWYEMTALLRKYNVQAVLSGHYHRNALLNYDQIPGIVSRSTLRANASSGGYSVFTISDSLHVAEKITGQNPVRWLSLPLGKIKYFDLQTDNLPNFDVNRQFSTVKQKWIINTRKAIFSSPAFYEGNVFFGDDNGFLNCVNASDGKTRWSFKTGSRIVSTPAVFKDKVVFGSTDGGIYCLDTNNGNLHWNFLTSEAVLGNALILSDTVYIGGSDGCFRAIDMNTGKLMWEFCELKGYVETKPVFHKGKLIFGAWDSYLYAIDAKTGKLLWKWNNGQERIHFSPAAVWPVVSHDKVFITAPDRFLTAIDVNSGKIVWRTNKHTVRETIGISADKNTIYSRCMTDSVIAFDAKSNSHVLRWKTFAGFGYDHNPSMLMEINGVIVFGTKNGLICGIRARDGKLKWQHKVGNTSIHTVTPLRKKEFLITTIDGKLGRIKF